MNMKRLGFLCLALLLPLLSHADGRRLEILFMGDQGHHKPNERYPQLIKALGVHGMNFSYTENMDDLNPKTLSRYDGLMLYANINTISSDQEQAVLDYVAAGKAFLPIHCASYCWRNSKAMVELMGGQFKRHGAGTFTVPIDEPEHPIMQGFEPFETWDETYVHHLHNEKDRTVLQFRDENGTPEPWTWVRTHGKGRIFYTAYGHDQRTWSHPGFHDLVRRGVLWAVNDEARAAWAALKPAPLEYEKRETVQNYEKRKPYPRFQFPLSPDESKKYIQWPAEFDLDLFASEPDVINPIYIQWDERGRLWVAETLDYPNQVNDNREGNDRIKICEDTDGDGKADTFTIFADKLNIPTAFVFVNGGVMVAAAPHFYFLKDTDGDDRADQTSIVSSGWGVGDTHAGPSNLKYGFDNFLYGCVGYSGYRENGVQFGRGIYRFKADFSYVEFLGQFSNNSWGLGFSESFDLFGSTANNCHSVYVGIPMRYYTGIDGLSPRRA
ncbi:MAG: PVC-type heme-binding CxxCH protein, partial [Verrucomicrobiota bacterium]